MHRGIDQAEFIQIINGSPALPDRLEDFFTEDQIIDLGLQSKQQILTKKRLKNMFDNQIIKQKELYEPLGEYLYQEKSLLGPRFILSDMPIIKTYHNKWTICELEAKLNTVYESHPQAYIGGVLKAGPAHQSDQLIYSTQTHIQTNAKNTHVFLKEAKSTSIWNIRSLQPIIR